MHLPLAELGPPRVITLGLIIHHLTTCAAIYTYTQYKVEVKCYQEVNTVEIYTLLFALCNWATICTRCKVGSS